MIIPLTFGDLVRVDAEATSPGGVAISLTQYSIGNMAMTAMLTCLASERPADAWFSIVETFEFLATGKLRDRQ